MDQVSNLMSDSHRMKGVSLVELMMASVMSVLIIIAVLTLYVNSQHSSRTQSLTRQIQENGRFAVQLISEDLRMAKYFGLNIRHSTIDTSVTDALPTSYECGGTGWATKVSEPIFASNNTNPYSGTCISADSYQSNTDVLVIRHTESEPLDASEINVGHLYLYTSLTDGETFRATTKGAVNSTTLSNITEVPAATYKFSTNVYYIRPFSDMDDDDGIPTLVRQSLSADGTTVEPLVQFVENLQVSLGIDTSTPSDNTINRYVNPSNVSDWSAVLSARIDVLIRSSEKATGYNEAHTYQIGEEILTVSDGYYRKVFTGTFFLRNPSLDT
jgi:type IV pilus assembly protein PilW